VQDICAHSSGSINSASEVKSEESLPGHVRLHLKHLACIESEKSTGDDNENGVGNYGRQYIGGNVTRTVDDKETHTKTKDLKVLQCKVILAHHEISQTGPDLILQILGDQSKLREASVQLTKEAKRGDLDMIVWARVAAMIGLLNIYTNDDLKYSWRKSSEIVAKAQGRGTNHVQCICKWAMGFLRWRDLPLHHLNWKQLTVLNDEDLAEEIKARMVEKGTSLKAEDLVEIVASPELQAIFTRKGMTKASISLKTAHRWLKKLGWTYKKLKNGMYIDGHERFDVVEYR
jgi:hypothetical protein